MSESNDSGTMSVWFALPRRRLTKAPQEEAAGDRSGGIGPSSDSRQPADSAEAAAPEAFFEGSMKMQLPCEVRWFSLLNFLARSLMSSIFSDETAMVT